MADAIIFKITDAGKSAALIASQSTPKVHINLTQVAIGSGQYTPIGTETALVSEISRENLVSGGVETASNTLRFSANISLSTQQPIYEIGLITDSGVLFAVAASSTNALFTVHPDITFAVSFGLSLNEVGTGNITVTTDPSGAIALVIMENHLAAPDPHPQYINAARVQFLFSVLIPFGYIHHTHSKVNPKPLFDELMGISTDWRLLEGVQIVGVDTNDSDINSPMVLIGQKGNVTKDLSTTPNSYPLRTTYMWERFDDSDESVLYDGRRKYNGETSYQ